MYNGVLVIRRYLDRKEMEGSGRIGMDAGQHGKTRRGVLFTGGRQQRAVATMCWDRSWKAAAAGRTRASSTGRLPEAAGVQRQSRRRARPAGHASAAALLIMRASKKFSIWMTLKVLSALQ